MVEFGKFDNSDMEPGVVLHTCEQGGAMDKLVDLINVTANAACGVAEGKAPGIVAFKGKFDAGDFGAGEILEDLSELGTAASESTRENFLNTIVTGDNESTKLMRDVFRRCIGAHPGTPREDIRDNRDRYASTMANWTMALECKKCAAGKIDDTAFAKDLARGLKVKLPGKQNIQTLTTIDGDGKTKTVFPGEGSTIGGEMNINIRPKELERLSGLDFTKFDDTEINAIINDDNATGKLVSVDQSFPKTFQLDVTESSVHTHATYDLR